MNTSQYLSSSEKVGRVLYSILSVILTLYAVLVGSEFLYNGIRFTKGPQMAVFVIPIIPVFIAGFVFVFLGPILVGRFAGKPGFHRRAVGVIGWQALACGIIGFMRIIVLNAIFETEFTITVGLLGLWFFYATVGLSFAGIILVIVRFAGKPI
jgi:hypothetical protein